MAASDARQEAADEAEEEVRRDFILRQHIRALRKLTETLRVEHIEGEEWKHGAP